MNRFLSTLLATVIVVAFVSFAQATKPPNVIVLFADDLGCGELSCQGNPEIPTPHIDSIASNGVRFTDGYVTGPNCASATTLRSSTISIAQALSRSGCGRRWKSVVEHPLSGVTDKNR